MIPTSPTSDPGGPSPGSSTKPVIITESKGQTEKAPQAKTSTTRTSTPRGSGGRGEFQPLPFLYRMLLGIFLAEAAFLGFSFVACRDLALKQPPKTIQEHCPRMGERAENLFGVAVATVLSLLGGAALSSKSKRDDQTTTE